MTIEKKDHQMGHQRMIDDDCRHEDLTLNNVCLPNPLQFSLLPLY
jgi:hypothetical protein